MFFIRKLLNDFSLKKKLTITFILITLFNIIAIGYFTTRDFSGYVLEHTNSIYRNTANQLEKNLINRLKSFKDISQDIIYDKKLLDYLRPEYGETKDITLLNEFKSNIDPLLNRAYFKEKELKINIYTLNDKLKFSSVFIRDESELKKRADVFKNSHLNVMWEGIVENKSRKYLAYSVPIYDLQDHTVLGILQLKIDMNIINQLFVSEEYGGNFVVIRNDKEHILAETRGFSERDWIPADPSRYISGNTEYVLIENTVTNAELSFEGWKVQFFVPMSSIKRNVGEIVSKTIMIVIISLIGSVLIILFISSILTKRMELLIRNMEILKSGQFDISVDIKGQDEIGRMGQMFNTMVFDLKKLMKELQDANAQVLESEIRKQAAETEKKQAQLLSLQSQINPHFLFNTLESIRMNILVSGDNETAEIIRLFADMFRRSIFDCDDYASIREEIEFVGQYFRIQKYRYGDKVSIVIDADERLFDAPIPKFILQPLIENSLYHGIELKDGPGTVKVTIRSASAGMIGVMVSDDGIGIGKQRLEEIKLCLEKGRSSSSMYALDNIRKRLRLLYEDNVLFSINSMKNGGTDIYIEIPRRDAHVQSPDRG